MAARRMAGAAVGAFALSLLSTTSFADTPADAAARFGARKAVQQVSLSPDGTRLVSVQPIGGRASAIFITDLSGAGAIAPKPIFRTNGNPDRLSWCRWAGTARLVCQTYATSKLPNGNVAYFARLFALDPDGTHVQMIPIPEGTGDPLGMVLSGDAVINWTPGQAGHVLMTRVYVPEKTTGMRTALTAEGLGVDDVELASMKSKIVEPAQPMAVNYIADTAGEVRISAYRVANPTGYDTGETIYRYRKVGGRDWRDLSSVKDREGFRPYGFDAAADSVIGLKKVDGRVAAYRKALDGTGTETVLLARPDVDVEGFLRLGPHARIIGVTYATDRQFTVYIDPDLKALDQTLSRAMPGRAINFVDESADGKKVLIWVGADIDPGRYYIFDRTNRHLDELMLDRPPLAGQKLAAVKAITYPAADGVQVPAYLTLPPGGQSTGKALVMPHGGPSARDEWGFDWMAQFYAAQGYVVLQPNYRGSAGYGDDWMNVNGFRGWRTSIGDVTAAGRWLVAQGLAQPGRLGIIGWSYGGYAALQSAVVDPALFKAVIAIAPVTDFAQLREESRYWSNYLLMTQFVGEGDEVAAGSPARHADRISAPVLLFHGLMDRNVSIDESRLMERRLKGAGKLVQLVTYDGLDHSLDDSDARTDLLSRSVQFLDANLGK